MDKDFLSVGSENEGDEVGLREGEVWVGGDRGCGRGKKSTNESSDGCAYSLMACGEYLCRERGERIGVE